MNAPGAYDDLDMNGLPSGLYRDVPVEMQRTLVGAYPDLRLLWNPHIQKYQCAVREPGNVQANYGLDGKVVMQGWLLIYTHPTMPATADDIVHKLRRNEAMAAAATEKEGGVCSLAEKLAEEIVEKKRRELEAKFEDFFGVNYSTGYVAPLHDGQVRSRPYGSTSRDMTVRDLPVAPSYLARFVPTGARPRGRKEIERRERRLNASLREGVPL